MRRLGGVELFITSDGGNDMELSKDLLPDDSGWFLLPIMERFFSATLFLFFSFQFS